MQHESAGLQPQLMQPTLQPMSQHTATGGASRSMSTVAAAVLGASVLGALATGWVQIPGFGSSTPAPAPAFQTVAPANNHSLIQPAAAAILLPVATIKRIEYVGTGESKSSGFFAREANNVWTETNGSGQRNRLITVTETDREILLLDDKRDMQLWLDFTKRKWFWRRSIAAQWSGGSDIVDIITDVVAQPTSRALP